MTILKNTPEGRELTYLLQKSENRINIVNHLDDVFLAQLSLVELRKLVEKELSDSYKRGSDHKAAQIRTALGV